MEVFLKRAENPFRDKIGEEKAQTFFEDLKIAQRWPSFQKILDSICIYKTG